MTKFHFQLQPSPSQKYLTFFMYFTFISSCRYTPGPGVNRIFNKLSGCYRIKRDSEVCNTTGLELRQSAICCQVTEAS